MRQLLLSIMCIALLMPAVPVLAEELASWEDPEGDDTGDGDYTYPTHEAFGEGGEADMLSFSIEKDDGTISFVFRIRNLVDPWDVGNRLTMVAVAIDTEDGGDEELRRNANVLLDEPSEYQIFAAGEVVEVFDASSERIDVGATLQTDMENGVMRITVPIESINGAAEEWLFTPAVGLQDDYGGGGLGDFREVKEVAGEWRGGGGHDLATNPNVYDIIVPEPRKILGIFGGSKRTQEEILEASDPETGRLASLPALSLN
jgi:carbohydrate-binding DOMON domain-containing protein